MIRILLLAAVLCSGCAGQLHSAESAKQQVAKRSYLALLKSEHEGVRNSTIFRVLQYQAAYPAADRSDFIKRLQQISAQDPSAKNRMYAFLACALLQDEKLLAAAIPPAAEEEKEAYFARVHEVIQLQSSVVMNEE